MDIQSTLTQAIEFIVMSFVGLMIFDFIDGLYVVPLPAIAIAQSNANSESTVTATQFELLSNTKQLVVEPQQIPFVRSQFWEIPDPWTLETDSYNSSTEIQPLVLQFPSLKLLPPATEVQPKARTTRKSTAKPKSTTIKKSSKPNNKAATPPRSDSRKKSAA